MKNKVGVEVEVEKDEDDGLFTREGVCMTVTGKIFNFFFFFFFK